MSNSEKCAVGFGTMLIGFFFLPFIIKGGFDGSNSSGLYAFLTALFWLLLIVGTIVASWFARFVMPKKLLFLVPLLMAGLGVAELFMTRGRGVHNLFFNWFLSSTSALMLLIGCLPLIFAFRKGHKNDHVAIANTDSQPLTGEVTREEVPVQHDVQETVVAPRRGAMTDD